ncbi:MAG: peptide-binding protein [Elusimicrobia bacterium]|nr:peptide-binding protein [Candidatus Obscuribacterium magneticum]
MTLMLGCQLSPRRNHYDPRTVDPTPVDGDTFIEASIGDASVLNPLLASDSASGDINALVYNGLLKYDKNIKLTGDLAESWTVSPDNKTITFKLRKGVLWHDGIPFTATDALFTYQMLVASTTKTPFGSDFLLAKKAEAPDPQTFRVRYGEPFAPALESWTMGIIPKHIFERGDLNTHPANRQPIGTGPYMFKEWQTDEKIVLVANPKYFEGRPHFDRFVYRIIPDMSVQFLELRQGALSMMSPTPDQFNGYEAFFTTYNKFHYPAFQFNYVGFNLKNELFKDRRVRQALACAVNKKDIIEGIYLGWAVPATGPYPPASWAYNPDVKDSSYDLNRARTLLKEAGWLDRDGDGLIDKEGKPFQFTLITNQGNKVRESMAQILQNNFGRIGIKMDIRVIEWSVFIHKFIDERAFDACLLGWNLGRDPDQYSLWHSGQTGKNQYNFVSYKNPEVDRLLEAGRRTFDVEKRKAIYHKMHALIAQDVPYIFLVNPESLVVVHKKILGVEPAPAGLGWNFIHWFVPKAWQTKADYAE